MPPSHLENQFLSLWKYHHPTINLETEQKLIDGRRFRVDFCHKAAKVAIEIQGGCFIRGKHSRGAGQTIDYTKLNLLAAAGWLTFQLSSTMIDEDWINVIAQTIKNRC